MLHFAPLGVQHAEFRRVAHLDLTSGRSRHGQALTCLPQLLLVVLWISSLQSLSERREPQQLRWLCGVIDSQKRLSSVLSAESNKRVSALCRQYRSGIFFQFCSAWLTAALCDVASRGVVGSSANLGSQTPDPYFKCASIKVRGEQDIHDESDNTSSIWHTLEASVVAHTQLNFDENSRRIHPVSPGVRMRCRYAR